MPDLKKEDGIRSTYDPHQDVIATTYGEGVSTSNGDAAYLKAVEGVPTTEHMVEANYKLILKFLNRLFKSDKLQEKINALKINDQPLRILEGGPGRGNSLRVYQELRDDGTLPNFQLTSVELSDDQFEVQHREALERFGSDNVFVTTTEELFSPGKHLDLEELQKKYQCILIKGNFEEFLENVAVRQIKFDTVVMIESIIHMNRKEVIQRVAAVLAQGGFVGLSDIGIEEKMKVIAPLIKFILSKVNSITPELISWWQEHYHQYIAVKIDATEDIRETTKAINKRLHDAEIREGIIQDLIKGGKSRWQAVLKVIKDGLLFTGGQWTTTSYFLVMTGIEELASEEVTFSQPELP